MRCTWIAAVLLLSAGVVHAQNQSGVGVTPEEAKEGFVSLFDGKTHAGWQGDVKGYPIEDGTMVCKPGDFVYTVKEYANFILRFEFKLPPGGNNGVGIRTPMVQPSAYHGMEIQILDDGHEKYKGWLQPYQTQGSIYGVVRGETRIFETHRPVELRRNRGRRPSHQGHAQRHGDYRRRLQQDHRDARSSEASGPAQCEGLHRLARSRRPGGLPQRADQGAAVRGARDEGWGARAGNGQRRRSSPLLPSALQFQ